MLAWFRHLPFTFWLVAVLAATGLIVAASIVGSSPSGAADADAVLPVAAAPDADRQATMALRASMVELLAVVRDGGDPGPWAERTARFAGDLATARAAAAPAGDAIARAWTQVADSAARLAALDPADRFGIVAETRTLASYADALVVLTGPGGLTEPGAGYLAPVPAPADPTVPGPDTAPSLTSPELDPKEEQP